MSAVPACPSCGAARWLIPMSAEVLVDVAGGAITHVTVTDPNVAGEGDPRCALCGHLLLDWNARTDDATWNAHHDERRPAWDELLALTQSLPLPSIDHWHIA